MDDCCSGMDMGGFDLLGCHIHSVHTFIMP